MSNLISFWWFLLFKGVRNMNCYAGAILRWEPVIRTVGVTGSQKVNFLQKRSAKIYVSALLSPFAPFSARSRLVLDENIAIKILVTERLQLLDIPNNLWYKIRETTVKKLNNFAIFYRNITKIRWPRSYITSRANLQWNKNYKTNWLETNVYFYRYKTHYLILIMQQAIVYI